MSLVVIFPVGKEASADAYLAFCNANNPDLVNEPDVIWYPNDVFDAYGQRVVGYLGPGGRADLTAEPTGGPAARADGILQEGYDPIPEEG